MDTTKNAKFKCLFKWQFFLSLLNKSVDDFVYFSLKDNIKPNLVQVLRMPKQFNLYFFIG